MRVARAVLPALALAAVLTPPAGAHEAFPAKLRVEEIETGSYEVSFTLPIIEGRKLRAQPLLPPTCEEVTARETGPTPGGVTTTWKVLCSPPLLAGEAILIDGLLGTQTDLMAQVITLDGRVHTAILKPSRPGFLVPPPPPIGRLARDATLAGVRRTLSHPELWLLLLAVVPLALRSLAAGVLAFAAGHAGAQWLAGSNWLLLSPHLPTAAALVIALSPALALVLGRSTERGWLRPLWPIALLLGLLYGGAHPEGVPPEGLSSAEQAAAQVLFTVGVALGLSLLAAIAAELRMVVNLVLARRSEGAGSRLLGFVVAALAIGLLLHRASVLLAVPDALPAASIQPMLLAAVLGAALTLAGAARAPLAPAYAGLVGVGLALGLGGVSLPGGTLPVVGSLFLFGLVLALGTALPLRWTAPIAAVAVVSAGWHTAGVLRDNVSLPVGTAVGTALVAVVVLHLVTRSCETKATGKAPAWTRALGAAAAILAVLWRLGEYRLWFDREVATEAALGLIRLPLLALALLGLCLAVWPRRRRALARIGIETRRTSRHWVLLALALFAIPIGSVAVRNPLYEPHAPTGEEARRVLARVLDNTYRAFNLADEDALYDQLAANVTTELVTDIYLDSRRRLTAGTRQGAEVTVRDVSVLEVGESVSGSDGGLGFSYDCRWVVTSRVRHLQHIHHRQNIYDGVLTIRVDDARWKIAWVELTGEERVILPWTRT